MKGILLAGGSGTRLYPLTKSISKQLLPIYNKPALYYPLSVLMLTGIREILIISTPRDLPFIQGLLGDGKALGLRLQYAQQLEPKGIAEALVIGESFLDGSPCALILGDNLFYSNDLQRSLVEASKITHGAKIFGYHVQDPERYGVVELDARDRAISLEEKPTNPKSHWAVTGLYFYDGNASQYAKALKPSARGELEITSLNRVYLERGELSVERLGRGVAWLDTGTFDSLLESSQFVQTLEKRQGLLISCVEEIAYRRGFIDRAQLTQLVESYGPTPYGKYLAQVLDSSN